MKKLIWSTAAVFVFFLMTGNGIAQEDTAGQVDEEIGVIALLVEQSDADSTDQDRGETGGVLQPGRMGMGPGGGSWMGPMGRGAYRGPSRAGWLLQYLNLTPDQIAKLKELRTQYFIGTRDLRYDIAMRRLEFMRLFTDPKASEADLTAKHKELSALYQKKIEQASQMIVQGRSILTPEQIAKLNTLPPGRGMMWGGRSGMRQGMGAMMGPRMMDCPLMAR